MRCLRFELRVRSRVYYELKPVYTAHHDELCLFRAVGEELPAL